MNSSFLAPITKLARSVSERGWRGTYNQLYLIGDIKFGECKGTDAFGNKYYENMDLPFGQHRWVEYSNIHNPDASMIQPEWHGWMHHMFDETPAEMDAMEKLTQPTTTTNHAIYSSHVALTNPKMHYHDKETTTASQFRPRGYGVGSLHSGPGEEHYYKQPGHPLNKEPGHFRERKEMEEWTPDQK